MGQVLHGCAITAKAVRRAVQNSQESLRALAKRYGINQKAVAKWTQRETVADRLTGSKEASRPFFPSRRRRSSLFSGPAWATGGSVVTQRHQLADHAAAQQSLIPGSNSRAEARRADAPDGRRCVHYVQNCERWDLSSDQRR